jgi:ankyrin repeat protein
MRDINTDDSEAEDGSGPEDEAVALAHMLFDAAREGDTAVLRSYLDAGAPASLTTAGGDSLLMLAAYHGHAELTAGLAERGADVNRLNSKNQAPLAGAIFKNEADVIRVLIEHGADVDAGTPSARATAQMFGRELPEPGAR